MTIIICPTVPVVPHHPCIHGEASAHNMPLASPMQFPPPPLQVHTTRASADELEAYLKGQEVQAKEAEFLALARADDGERRRPCGEGGAKDNVVGF